MKLLLDTHAFVWWVAGNPLLSVPAQTAIANRANEVIFSAASAWEITTKYRLGKMPIDPSVAADIGAELRIQGFSELGVTVRHGQIAGALPGAHKDPFDRMLIAQAIVENLVLVSNEQVFETFGVHRLW